MNARVQFRLMNRALAILLLAGVLAFALNVRPAAAKSESGGVVDPSTVLGFGPRPAAMGNAFAALSDDATSAFWNPAALDMNRRKELFGQYSQAFFDNTSYNMIAYKHPIDRFGTIGGGLILEGVDDLTKRDVNAGNIGTFNVSKMNVMFSYGKQLAQGFYLGSSLHIVRHQIAEFSGTGFGLDLAALYRFTNAYVEYSRAYLNLARGQLRQESERLYSQGMTAYERGKYADAFENFRKAVETNPEDKSARKMLLNTVQKDHTLADRLKAKPLTNGYPTMAEFLRTHGESGESLKNLSSWFDEGVKLYDAGKLKESIPFFEAVIRHARSNFLTDRLALGLNLQNLLEPSIKLKSTADDIPMNIKLGTAYKLTDWLQFALDLDVPSKGPHRIHFGMEWKPLDWLAVRAGIDHDEPTFGFGFKYQDLKIDYAFMPSNELDNDFQRVGLSYEFGKSQGDIATERIQRGLALQSKKDYQAARQEWETAQRLQPTNPLPRRYIQESEEDYHRSVVAPMAEAERYLASGQIMEAHPILNSILAYDPSYEPARKAMEKLTGEVFGYVENHFHAGYLKFLQADYSSALEEMNRVLYFRPSHRAAERYREQARKYIDEASRRQNIQSLYDDAMTQYRAGRMAEAQARFESVLHRDPSHPTAGAILDMIGQFQTAGFLPEELDIEADKYLRLARAEFLEDNPAAAEILVSHSLALAPADVEARSLLSRIQARKNMELIEIMRRGDESMSKGAADAAVAAWRQVLERDPGNFDAQKRLERAVDAIRNFIDGMNREAARLETAGSLLEALKNYNRVLAIDPFNDPAESKREELRPKIYSYLEKTYSAAESFYQHGELEKSIELLNELIAVVPDVAQPRDLQAMAKHKLEENMAIARMNRLYNEASEQFSSRNYDQSVALWQEVVQSAPKDNPDAGRIVQDAQSRIAEAVGEAQKQQAESTVQENLQLGDQHMEEGRPLDALMAYRAALDAQPDNYTIQWRIESAKKAVVDRLADWISQGGAAFAEQRFEDAEAFFQSVLGVDPENSEALDGMARVQAARDEAAHAALAKAAAAEAAKTGRPPEKEKEVRKPTVSEQVSRLSGRAADFRQKSAQAQSQNRLDLAYSRAMKALDLYREVLKLDRANEQAKQAVADLIALTNQLQKSSKDKMSGDVQKYLYSGMGHYRAGRLKEAIADWNRVLAIDPTHAQAKEYIKRAEKKMNLLEK